MRGVTYFEFELDVNHLKHEGSNRLDAKTVGLASEGSFSERLSDGARMRHPVVLAALDKYEQAWKHHTKRR